VASLVCCTDVELGLFGEVGEELSVLGDKERTNDHLTIISSPSFTVRWTCLSLVAIWKILDSNKVRELARFALDGFARFQTGYSGSDTMALTAAQRIDDYLEKGWASVVDLRQAFKNWSQDKTESEAEPWSQDKRESEIREFLNSYESSILELERIAIEAVGVEDVDWRISLLQDTMDVATHKLMRRLPGVFFDFSSPVPPQLIFPGQQIQSLCTLGRRLRDIVEGQNTETHEETLESLESLREIPVALRGLDYLMKRQLWRLMDLRDGYGLGFTVELFFLALGQLSSTSPSSKLNKDFYTGTFKVITSNWEKSKNLAGTQRILLDLLCDLVIQSRGVFSSFSYPPYIVDILLDLVEKMVQGRRGLHPHIDDVIQELENDNFWHRMDSDLRDKALNAIHIRA
jgi:hypothetical protein